MVATVDENTPRLSVDAAQLLADLPPRVARMETHIEYMRLDIAELKAGPKELRTELKSEVAGLVLPLTSHAGRTFRKVLADAHRYVAAPCVYDCASARAVQMACLLAQVQRRQ